MSYLTRLREQEAKKEKPGEWAPSKPTKPIETEDSLLPKLTEPGCVSSASADTHTKKTYREPPAESPASDRTEPPKLTKLFGYTSTQRRAIIEARDLAPLLEFRQGLTHGRLRLCANCRHFTFAQIPSELGDCDRFGESWPFAPAPCESFEVGSEPAAPRYLPEERS